MDLEEQRHDRADRDQSRPPPQNQHRSLHGVADAQHAVMQMHTVRVHRRLPVAESAHDRQTHVQHWQEQHQDRQQDRHEHRQVHAGMNRRRIQTAGHHD